MKVYKATLTFQKVDLRLKSITGDKEGQCIHPYQLLRKIISNLNLSNAKSSKHAKQKLTELQEKN